MFTTMFSYSLPKTSFHNHIIAGINYPCHRSMTLSPFRKIVRHRVDASLDSNPPESVRRSLASRKEDCLIVPYGFKSSGNAEDDHSALDAVHKLHSAIEQRNLRELSKVIGDECQCVCNFIPYFQPFHGKKEVLEFFVHIMKYMGKNMELVVQPTLHDGMTVTVRWKLEWDKTHMPLGKGFSLYVCHTYRGKVVIKHMEMIMEPVFHLEPLRLKIIGLVTLVLEKISSYKSEKKRITSISLAVVTIVAILVFLMLFHGSA